MTAAGEGAAVPARVQDLTAARLRTRRVVYLSLAIQIPQTAAIAAAAVVTGSSALVAQTFAAAADLAVQAFLGIGVRTSSRVADSTHPLGYGRERYFWSLFAAIGIFVSGFSVAALEALRSGVNPAPVTSFTFGYVVLGVSLVLDVIAFAYVLRVTRLRARAQGRSTTEHLRRTTEPATVTELLGSGIGLAGGALAIVALALTQATGRIWPDAIASGLIGLTLMAAAVVLTQQNRSLLTGRGVHPQLLEEIRSAIAAQPGVVDIPDLFAIVVGPSMLVVDGDVTLEDELNVPEAEAVIDRAAAELRSRWPEVRYVYLTPVAERRPRGAHRGSTT
jgi:cation diffusion facilitator family transporter